MTVYIEKPAVNLREELASLRNQGGYQEQQFYFDKLVTNGTFDADISGWTGTSATLSSVGGQLVVTPTTTNPSAYSPVTLVIGETYQVQATLVNVNGSTNAKQLQVGTSVAGGQMFSLSFGTTPQTLSGTFVATATVGYVNVYNFDGTNAAVWDNISVFETDGTNVIHTMPKGWKPKDVFEDGLLQREGAAHDYTVVYDGFDYKVKPTVAPSATTQTCVIGVKA
jgi:hypothetical protein